VPEDLTITEVLLHLFAVFVAARAISEVAERVGVPAVIGEIVAWPTWLWLSHEDAEHHGQGCDLQTMIS
jgi:hypothetical protein